MITVMLGQGLHDNCIAGQSLHDKCPAGSGFATSREHDNNVTHWQSHAHFIKNNQKNMSDDIKRTTKQLCFFLDVLEHSRTQLQRKGLKYIKHRLTGITSITYITYLTAVTRNGYG